MFLVPYRFSLDLHITPLLTILVSVACLIVYASQSSHERKLENVALSFCEERLSSYDQMMLANVSKANPGYSCPAFLLSSRVNADRDQLFVNLARESGRLAGYSAQESVSITGDFLRETYQRFDRNSPAYNPMALAYRPHSWDPVHMVTAAFAHASWSHVIGNLFFFFAFAAAVEAAIGSLAYIGVFLIMAFGSHIAYSAAMMGVPDALPTVGLSGVVMGMMALLTYLAPSGRINCFYWIFIRFGVIAVPAWALFLWFAGWDTYTLTSSNEMGEINLIAHVSGAAIGYITGFILFRKQKRRIADELGTS